jgi:hypothetical protein
MSFLDEPRDWTQAEGIALATAVEEVAPKFGAHVALTGGLLYKRGTRKDADLLFYRIRQQALDLDGLKGALADIGLTITNDYGFVKKAKYRGKTVDLLFPEQCQATPTAPAPPGRYS